MSFMTISYNRILRVFHFGQVSDGRMAHILGVKKPFFSKALIEFHQLSTPLSRELKSLVFSVLSYLVFPKIYQ